MRAVIIILTYNAERYLEECLDSVMLSLRGPSRKRGDEVLLRRIPRRGTIPDLKYKVLVVDNASTDRTKEIAKKHPVELIVNPENYGFGKGNNVGIKRAMEWGADYIILLNQDLIVSEGWLEPLLETMEGNQKIAACQPLIMLKNEPDKINSAGNQIHFSGFGYVSRLGYSLSGARPFNFSTGSENKRTGGVEGYAEVPYAMGSCLVLRASAVKEVGLFDEAVFMYHDDMDLCLRLRLKGYQLVLVPRARVYHYFKDKMTPFSYYWLEINRLWIPLKFFRIPTLIVLAPANLVFGILLFGYSVLRGFTREWAGARLFTLKNLFHILSERSQIQKTRQISDRELSIWITGKIGEVRGAKMENSIRRILSLFFEGYWQLARFVIFW